MRATNSQIFLIFFFCILLAGCSPAKYRQKADETAYRIISEKQQEALGGSDTFSIASAENQLRRRLLDAQQLPFSGPASLGSNALDRIDHWPEEKTYSPTMRQNKDSVETLTITLVEALQIGSMNSRDYQSRKEDIFRAALALDLERDIFRNSFSSLLLETYNHDRSDADAGTTEGLESSTIAEISRNFKNGASLTASIGFDLVQLLQPSRLFSDSIFGDASITIPLLRGARAHIVTEPLTQAEREALYAIWNFERFKKEFAVSIANNYLSVLQAADQELNQEENYRGLIASSRRAIRLAEAGKMTQLQVDQSIQNELRARDRWITTRQSHANELDSFKTLLGLPADADIRLDRDEFSNLEQYIYTRLTNLPEEMEGVDTPPADAPIFLIPPRKKDGGPLEIDPEQAIVTALKNRLDLRISEGRVYDAQRQVIVAADNLKGELTLFGSVNIGERRSLASVATDNSRKLDFSRGSYQGLLTLDLPLERTLEAIDYRDSFISLEKAVRAVQELEDRVKLQVRNDLRTLERARTSLKVQYQAVKLAERRVRGATLFLEAGRTQIRDLLEARESLLAAQNALTAAMVDYRIAELELQRDIGLLQTDNNGLWHEIDTEAQAMNETN